MKDNLQSIMKIIRKLKAQRKTILNNDIERYNYSLFINIKIGI
ncbi:hypothetical protein IWX80_002679 [Flavobacterium sp. CAN_S2]